MSTCKVREHFILDIKHDSHAQLATLVYANSVRNDNPLFAEDIIEWLIEAGRIISWNAPRQMWMFNDEADKACEHRWVDASNEVVNGGEICTKCHAVRSGLRVGDGDPINPELLKL